ncbi:hypothetical protein HanRHA438_Chr05g0228701 [Helianthus annuus]|nr:hypothetical protein HanRHA438_Chr05g0228701 [Helianthus annuus]
MQRTMRKNKRLTTGLCGSPHCPLWTFLFGSPKILKGPLNELSLLTKVPSKFKRENS